MGGYSRTSFRWPGDSFLSLAVAPQTLREAERIGVNAKIIGSQADASDGINITNYEKLHKIDSSKFSGVVLDESSILKCFSGATRHELTEAFRNTPYRLCCTATPAPE